jgi:hypothetical protein
MLRHYPVSGVTITENGTALAAEDFEVKQAPGDYPAEVYRLSSGTRLCWPYASVVVQYTGGYILPGPATRTLPFALEDVAIKLIKSAYLERGRDSALRSYDIPGVVSKTFWVAGPGEDVFPPE